MLIIGFFIVAGFISNGIQAQNVSKIERFLYDKCRLHSTEASAWDTVKDHYSYFSDYLDHTARLLPNGKKEFCSDEKPKLIGLMAQLARDLKPCFPRDEKYLPQFMADSFRDFLTFVCEGKTIENFFSSQGSECMQNLKQKSAGDEVGQCFRKLFATFDDTIKKDNLCSDLNLAKTCFGEAIAQHCPNFIGFESLNNKFFDAIRKPCTSGANLTLSSLIITLLAFLSTKFF